MKQNLLKNNFLYRTWDAFPNVFRVIVRMDRPVQESCLRSAVLAAQKRYPYLCVRVLRDGEQYRIVPNNKSVPVLHGKAPVCLGSDEADGHFIAVAYEGDAIFFDAYHNLCDAKGLMPWVKTVLFLYLRNALDSEISAEVICLPGDAFLPNETEDPYENIIIPEDLRPFSSLSQSLGVFVPDTRYAEGPDRRDVFIHVSASDYTNFFRTNDGSPVVLTAYFLKEMIKRLFPEREGLSIDVSIPHSIREDLLGENNFHDQVVTLLLRYDDRMDALPLESQLTAGRGSIILQSEHDNILCRIRDNLSFSAEVDALRTDQERRAYYQQSVAQIVPCPETMCISYAGRIDWGSLRAYIRESYVKTSVLAAPVFVEIMSLGDTFCFCFLQRDDTELYASTFVSILQEHGITAELIGSEPAEPFSVYIP